MDPRPARLNRGRPRKAYLRWKTTLTLDLEADRAVIEALFERIPRGRRSAFLREALRAAVAAGLAEDFLRVGKSGIIMGDEGGGESFAAPKKPGDPAP